MVLFPGCGCCGCVNSFPPCSIVNFNPSNPTANVTPTSATVGISVAKSGAYSFTANRFSPGVGASYTYNYNDYQTEYTNGVTNSREAYIYNLQNTSNVNQLQCGSYTSPSGVSGCSCLWWFNIVNSGDGSFALFALRLEYACLSDGQSTTIINVISPYKTLNASFGVFGGTTTIEWGDSSFTRTDRDADLSFYGTAQVIDGTAIPLRVHGSNRVPYIINGVDYWTPVEFDFTVVSAPPLGVSNPLP